MFPWNGSTDDREANGSFPTLTTSAVLLPWSLAGLNIDLIQLA